MEIVFGQLAVLYIFLLAGWLIGRIKKEKAPHADILSVIRLVVIPAIAFLICRGLRLVELAPMVLIITCMPCGLNTIVFPKLIGEDCKPGARLALITHVFSIVTLPFWLSLIL